MSNVVLTPFWVVYGVGEAAEASLSFLEEVVFSPLVEEVVDLAVSVESSE